MASSVVLVGFAHGVGVQGFWTYPLKIILLQLILTELHVVETKSARHLLGVVGARGVDVPNLALTLLACLIRSCLGMGRIVIVCHLLSQRLVISLHHRRLGKFGNLSLLSHESFDAWAAALNF